MCPGAPRRLKWLKYHAQDEDRHFFSPNQSATLHLDAASVTLGLVDADPQRSFLSWSEAVGDLPFLVIGLPVRDLRRRLETHGKGYDHIVIDTPPGDLAIIRSALMAAERVIIPVGPTLMEVDRLRPTIDLMAEVEALNSFHAHVLITRVRFGTKSAKTIREVLAADLGLPLLTTEIPLRESFAASFGLTPDLGGPYGDVVQELMAA